MNLFHFAPNPVVIEPRTYEQHIHRKPRGFWLAVDDGWEQYCRAHMRLFGTELRVKHRVEVDLANVLQISTVPALQAFAKEYDGVPDYMEDVDKWWKEGEYFYWADWPRVCAKYSGIIIAPFMWSMRLRMQWYYTWDVASGCIWETSAIKKIEVLNERPKQSGGKGRRKEALAD